MKNHPEIPEEAKFDCLGIFHTCFDVALHGNTDRLAYQMAGTALPMRRN